MNICVNKKLQRVNNEKEIMHWQPTNEYVVKKSVENNSLGYQTFQ